MLGLKVITNAGRLSKVAAGVSASFCARVAGLLFTVIATPVVLSSLGKEGFGLWSIVIQIVGFISFADLGMGNGLMNSIISDRHNKKQKFISSYIKTTVFFLSAVSIIFLLITISVTSVIDFKSTFSISSDSTAYHFKLAVIASLFLFLINMPLMVIQKVQFAYIHNAIFHGWETVSKLLSLFFVVFLAINDKEMPYLLAAFFIPPVVVNIFNWASYKNHVLTGWFNAVFSFSYLRRVFPLGILFLLLSISYIAGRSVDNFLLGYLGGGDAVADYQIPLKPFDLVLVFSMMITSVLWPAFGESIKTGDLGWATQALKNSFLFMTFVAVVFCVFMVFFGNDLIQVWLGYSADFSTSVFLSLSILILVLMWSNVLSSLLNSLSLLKSQIVCYFLYALVGLPVKALCYQHYGIVGFVLSSSLTFLVVVVIPQGFISYKFLIKSRSSLA